MRGIVWAAIAAPIAFAMAAHASAQAPAISYDKIVVPNLTFTADAVAEKNYWKYHYYWKPGVSFETALADVHECRLRSRIASFGMLHDFVPYAGSAAGPAARAPTPSGDGIIGGLIAAAATAATTIHDQRVNMNICMGFKNYGQYGLPKEIWLQINPEDLMTGDVIQAKIASGPVPATEALK